MYWYCLIPHSDYISASNGLTQQTCGIRNATFFWLLSPSLILCVLWRWPIWAQIAEWWFLSFQWTFNHLTTSLESGPLYCAKLITHVCATSLQTYILYCSTNWEGKRQSPPSPPNEDEWFYLHFTSCCYVLARKGPKSRAETGLVKSSKNSDLLNKGRNCAMMRWLAGLAGKAAWQAEWRIAWTNRQNAREAVDLEHRQAKVSQSSKKNMRIFRLVQSRPWRCFPVRNWTIWRRLKWRAGV